MTGSNDLERRYRRWLRWYPASFRREYEAEILGVLMAGAREGQRRPELLECLDLMTNGLRMRLRPAAPRPARSALPTVGQLDLDGRRIRPMRWNSLLLGALVTLLLVADFLTFHDVLEPHSVKDWLILIASLLAVAYVARLAATQVRRVSRR